jgi:hypothetical protein
MTRIVVPYSSELLDGLYAVVQHASKDDVIPVICTVRVTPRTFTATDRYSVGEWTHTSTGDDEAGAILLPRVAAEWLTKQTAKLIGAAGFPVGALFIHFMEESVEIRWSEDASGDIVAVTRFTAIEGNFPPVARLFSMGDAVNNDVPLYVGLSPAFLEKFTRGAKKVGYRDEPMRIQLTKGGDKPGPVLITFGQHFRGLLQPNKAVQ